MAAPNPRNPYQSHVVKASAGCGKTWQLSQRFLALVSAGADPATILTVTFTRKAAAEMRERILADAGKLIAGGAAADQFDQDMKQFHADSSPQVIRDRGTAPPPPRPASETGRLIIQQSQALKITTIDSIFNDWVAKFPAETGLAGPAGGGFSLLSELEKNQLELAAWESANRELLTSTDLQNTSGNDRDQLLESSYESSRESSHQSSNDGDGSTSDDLEENPDSTRELAMALGRHTGFIWHIENAVGDSQTNSETPPWLLEWAPGRAPATIEDELFDALAEDWRTLADCLKPDRRDALLALIRSKNLTGLAEQKFITAKMTLSGVTFRAKTIAGCHRERDRIEAKLTELVNTKKRGDLIARSRRATKLFSTYSRHVNDAKTASGKVSFDDLLVGTARIFASPDAAGARYLLQRKIRHLLLDEFQDTSWPQWNIFGEIANEIIAGSDDAQPGTIFLVGDLKQSIYGFRNSDPEIMERAAEELSGMGVLESPLNASYRTTKTILDFVNATCSGGFPDFPEHTPAVADGVAINPDVSEVTVLPVSDQEDLSIKDREVIEASMIASWFSSALADGGSRYPVCVKGARPENTANGSDGLPLTRPLRASDCAILFRSADRMNTVERALAKAGIPTMREESGNFFDQQEIRDAMELLRHLARPGDFNALLAVLKSPYFGLGDAALAPLLGATISQRHSPVRTREALATLQQILDQNPEQQFLLPATSATVPQPDLNWLMQLRETAHSHRPSELLQTAIDDSQYIARATQGLSAVEEFRVRNHLDSLVELIRGLESHANNNLHLIGARLRKMASLDNFKVSSIADQAADSINAVRLMTVHKAKGLEFPLVALVDTATPWMKPPSGWLKLTSDGAEMRGPMLRPGLLFVGAGKDRPENDLEFDRVLTAATNREIAEANRVWYVALTRARQYLCISGTKRKTTDSPGHLIHWESCLAAAKKMSSHSTALKVDVLLSLQSTDAPRSLRVSAETVRSPLLEKIRKTQPPGTLPDTLPDTSIETVPVPPGLQDAGMAVEHQPIPTPKTVSPIPEGIRILVASRFSGANRATATVDHTAPMSRSSVHAGPVAAAIGTFVHAGLECAVKKVPFNAEGRWIQICDANLLLNTRPDVALAFTEARRQLHQVLGSTAWQQLLASLPRHRTEVPITLLDQQQRLHAGTIDLLLDDGGPGRAPGHLMVVDFKTSAVDLPDLAVTGVTAEERAERIQETRSILHQHAVEHGYFEQISAYLESLAVVYPDAKKSGCIFYTRFCEMISL